MRRWFRAAPSRDTLITLVSSLPMTSFHLGIISDTHGLLRAEALAALKGSQVIIHAGDVGDPAILDHLKTIAPVFAVRGNVDTDPWASSLPLTEVVQLDSASIYVLHNLKQLDLNPAASGFHIVIAGHTHQPDSHWQDGVLYINPGSAGPRRFSLPISLARLDLGKTPWQVEFPNLPAN
jgi:putative phosphoesterase